MKKNTTIILALLISFLIIQIPNVSAINQNIVENNISKNFVKLKEIDDIKESSIKGFIGTIVFVIIWFLYIAAFFIIGIPAIIISMILSIFPDLYFKLILSSIWFPVQTFFNMLLQIVIELWE